MHSQISYKLSNTHWHINCLSIESLFLSLIYFVYHNLTFSKKGDFSLTCFLFTHHTTLWKHSVQKKTHKNSTKTYTRKKLQNKKRDSVLNLQQETAKNRSKDVFDKLNSGNRRIKKVELVVRSLFNVNPTSTSASLNVSA